MKKKQQRKNQPAKRTQKAQRAARPTVVEISLSPKSSLDPARTLKIVHRGPDLTGEAGQTGDTSQLSEIAGADSESVRDLVEEGQDFEAQIVSGVERAGGAVEARAGVPRRKRKQQRR